MKSKKFRLHFIILTIVLLLALAYPPGYTSAQSGSELSLPERVNVDTNFAAGSGNDIYFQPNAHNKILPHSFESEESSFDLIESQEMSRSTLGSYGPLSPFMASNTESIYQASNVSSEDLDIQYSSQYYDLASGNSGSKVLENIVLIEDKYSGVNFEVESDIPMMIDLKLKSSSDTAELNLYLLSPSGNLYDYSTTHSTDLNTFVHEQIPFLPGETGNFTLYLSPPNTDVVMTSLQIVSDLSIETVKAGFSDQAQGETTLTRVFQLQPNATTTPVILDLSSQQYISEALETYQQQSNLLGSAEYTFFTNGTDTFGNSLPSQVIYQNNTDIYIAITIQPPNENNKFIKAEKERLELEPGYDVDFSFWAELFDIPQLPTGQDLLIDSYDQPNSNYYYYSTSNPRVIGMNSTNVVEAQFMSLNDYDTSYTFDTTNNDILLDSTDTIVEVESGNYIVYISGTPDNDFRISTFNTLGINQAQSVSHVFSLNQPLIFELPVNQPSKEYMNITYMDHVNMSVQLEMSLHDGRGIQRSSSTYTFDAYSNVNDENYQVDNNTVIGSTSMTTHYNVYMGYLRVNVIGNTIWNSSLTNPTVIDSDWENRTSTFNIERMNYVNEWVDLAGDRELLNQGYSSTTDQFLNESKTDILYVYDFQSSTTPSGYNIQFSSTNVTYRVISFVDWTLEWFDVTVNTPTSIDGIDHYEFNMEFGTSSQVNFGFIIIFDIAGASTNGTFTTSMNQIQVQEAPIIQMNSIGVSQSDQVGDGPGNVQVTDGTDTGLSNIIRSPWTWVGVAALAGGIGALVYYLRTRGKTPF